AKANNEALFLATGKYILFLNPDTIVPEDCFTKCISFFESQPDAGALGIHMIDGSGKFLKESKRSFPSPITSLYKLLGLAELFPGSREFSKYHLGYLDENKNNEVDVLAGAFIMAPKEIIDNLGGFDEDFFMYGEDIDLSYRIQKAGYKNFYFAESSIIHFKGESTKKASFNYVRIFYKAMSIFVTKHYGRGKASIFNFLIQCAILLRALVSAARRFIQWIGMPVIDAATILFSFWLTKVFWNNFIRQEVRYSTSLLITASFIFTFIFLMASYFSGLYDSIYKQSKLNRSAIAGITVLLTGYGLLPESLRFSRGILVFGSLVAYALITFVRSLLVNFKLLESYNEDEHRQTIIAGSLQEYISIAALMRSAGLEERILGRVGADDETGIKAIGDITALTHLIKTYPIKEVILCEGKISFKEIIELVKTIPHYVSIKIFSPKSQSIIGSDSKNISGNYVTLYSNFRLGNKIGKRNKHLADIIISIIFIVGFPLHLLLQKKPLRFFKNVSDVFLRNKGWVGYASGSNDLPLLRPGVITVTGVPGFMNGMPEENLLLADKWYAKHYTIWHDIQLVWKGYKFLWL
ncbi:MAG: glycosyltransferase, partial [Ginsengibacter sp.]